VSSSYPRGDEHRAAPRPRLGLERIAPNARAVAIVNQAFVDEYLPGEEPLGREVKLGLETSEEPWLTIVGVAANVERFDFFNEMSLARPPVVYRPMAQQARAR